MFKKKITQTKCGLLFLLYFGKSIIYITTKCPKTFLHLSQEKKNLKRIVALNTIVITLEHNS